MHYKHYKLKFLSPLLLAVFITIFSKGLFGQDDAAIAMRARIHLYNNWDFDSVAYYLDRVIGNKYCPPFAYTDYGWFLLLKGKEKEGYKNIQRAAEMAPTDKQLAAWNSWALIWQGDLTAASMWINHALAVDPKYGEGLHVSSRIQSEMGNHTEAIKLAEKAASFDRLWRGVVPLAYAKAGKKEEVIAWAKKKSSINAYDAMFLMEAYAVLGMNEKALREMENAYKLKHPFMPWLEFVPDVKHLKNDPRFKEVVRKMNLP